MNFLVIVVDTVRRDYLDCYGGSTGTPALQALAAESVVFDQAFAGAVPTLPCRQELFTGRFTFPYLQWGPLPENEVILPQILSSNYINCGFITDNLPMGKYCSSYGRGFHHREHIRGQWSDRYKPVAGELPWPAPPEKIGKAHRVQQYLHNVAGRQAEEDYFAPMTVNAACRWLETYGRKSQFFLWVDIFDPHEPWDPPAHYVPEMKEGEPWIIYPHYGPADRYSPEDLESIRRLYRGELRMVDHWIGKLLRRLDELGLRDDTCVLFMADHGLYFGEHNLLGKVGKVGDGILGWPLYPEVSHVPMMWRIPGVSPRRVDAFTQPADVAPTILALAGVKQPKRMMGRSLVPVLWGKTETHRPHAVSSWSLRGVSAGRPSVIRDPEWTLVFWRTGVTPELYHRPTDPMETQNVARKYPAEVRRLHREYLRFLREQETPAEHYWPRKWLVAWDAPRGPKDTRQVSMR